MSTGQQQRNSRKRQADEQLSLITCETSEYGPKDFQILKTVGYGGFGKVFQVRKSTGSNQNQLYAMKVVRKSRLLHYPISIAHLVNERNIHASTDSPFLCKLHFTFQTDEKLYFVMEYLSGGDLLGLSLRKDFSEKDVKFYLSEIVLALEYLHSRDIVYRDLKLQNVMLDRNGHVKLTDFGMAKENVNSKNKTYTACGTPLFVAPEIIEQKGHGKEVDIWALGCMMHEMLGLGYAFDGDSTEELYDNILTSKVTLPRSFSKNARDLLPKLLTQDVSKRITLKAIERHFFFKGVNWKKVAALKMEPPFKPELLNEEDVSQFMGDFTSIPPVDSPTKTLSKPLTVDVFAGFSYTGDFCRMDQPSEEDMRIATRKW